MNPRSGIIVSQFKNAHTEAAAADRELDLLAQYMANIAQADDVSKISHKVRIQTFTFVNLLICGLALEAKIFSIR